MSDVIWSLIALPPYEVEETGSLGPFPKLPGKLVLSPFVNSEYYRHNPQLQLYAHAEYSDAQPLDATPLVVPRLSTIAVDQTNLRVR
jgi:hypothetical protein